MVRIPSVLLALAALCAAQSRPSWWNYASPSATSVIGIDWQAARASPFAEPIDAELWGDLGFPNFDTKYGKIGVQICWDQWYPEGSRLTALSGAQVIFYPTSIGWHPHEKVEFGAAQLDAWRTIQRAHAIANGIYVAVVNRVGYEGKPETGDPGLEFWGNSFVADPFGQLVAQASSDKEEILVVECDPAKSEDTRRNWPFLRDRRIDAYHPITNRWLGE